MRVKTYIVQELDKDVSVISGDKSTVVFLSVTKKHIFDNVYDTLNDKVSGIVIGESHLDNASKILRQAYEYKAQYFKVVRNNNFIPFVRKSNPLVYLKNGSWGVDLNLFRKKCHHVKGNIKMPEIELMIDEEYKGIGLVHDIAKVMDISKLDLPHMPLEEAQVYIARWGGAPGMEKYKTPYGL